MSLKFGERGCDWGTKFKWCQELSHQDKQNFNNYLKKFYKLMQKSLKNKISKIQIKTGFHHRLAISCLTCLTLIPALEK